MRHTARKLKKRKPLLTFTNTKLLHSKSTYFYKQRWNFYLVPAMCALALLLGVGFMINPITGNNPSAHAAINEDLGNGSTISLAISNNGTEISDGGAVSTEVEPGELAYISNSIKVTTNKIARYYVGIQAANDGTSDLVGTNTGATISGTGSNVKPNNFSDNTWGYVLTDNIAAANEDLAYNTLPFYNAGASLQYQSNQYPTNGEHEMKLVFAAKIRADKPADHYQTKALVSVAAEANKLTMANITYMQDMSADICSNTPEADADGNNQYQLKDNRDNKLYWVAKLKDGNCWMTQNLRLVGNITLTPEDSDINGKYTLPTSAVLDKTNDNPKHFSGNDQYQSKVYYENNTANGAYYNWYTATAGIGDASITSGNAPSSICPKGWRLPTGGSNGEFYILLNSLSSNTITSAPYNFVYGGNIDNSSLIAASREGYYWSSTANRASQAYSLYFATSVNPSSYSFNRYYGYSVRCVAR